VNRLLEQEKNGVGLILSIWNWLSAG